MNKYVYSYKNKVKKIDLPIGKKSRVTFTETEVVDANYDNSFYDSVLFIANPLGDISRTFFSSRGAYIMNGKSKFPYLEVKGCGSPGKGILNEYFLEDGRDKDLIHDPIGGFSLEKAIHEWEMLNRLRELGIETHIPVALLKLKKIKGPLGEDLALLIRSGKSNIRLSYLRGQGENYLKSIAEESSHSVGKGLAIMHDQLKLCHNALHEENITLSGELVDLEYASPVTMEGKYRDLWYSLLSFVEIFGTSFDISNFLRGYTNLDIDFKIKGKNMKEMENSSKSVANEILKIKG